MKPFMAQSILSKVDTCSNKTVISLLAGKTIEQLRELTDSSNIIARAMTNTPSKVSKTSDFKLISTKLSDWPRNDSCISPGGH
jgi:pyrroline-5-carboxylate reductase